MVDKDVVRVPGGVMDKSDTSVFDPQTKTYRYTVRFKLKDQRANKRDDKYDLLRSIIGGNLIGSDTDDHHVTISNRTPKDKYDRTPGISKPRHKYDTTDHYNPINPSRNAIFDVNRYKLPVLICNLTEDQANRLRKDPNIVSVEKSQVHKLEVQTIPWGITRVKAQAAWSAGVNSKGESVFVGDMDTGCNVTHEDLNFAQWTDARGWGHSFNEGDNTLQPTPAAGHHGTHTMGTIIAQDNDLGVVGVAPGARPFVLKIFDDSGFTNTDIEFAGMEFAMAFQIQVTNNSYGSVLTPGDTNVVYGFVQAQEEQWYQAYIYA